MATDQEMQAFVAKAADAFAEAESKLKATGSAVTELCQLIREGHSLGLAGYLQSNRMRADLLAASGKVAEAMSIVFAIHREGTDLAEKKGVDLPRPLDGSPR